MSVLISPLATVTQMLHVPTLLGTLPVVATMDTEEMAFFVMVWLYTFMHTVCSYYNRVSEVNSHTDVHG